MFNRLTAYISLFAMAAMLPGCVADDCPDVSTGSGTVTIAFRNAKASTRSADDNYNEDKISNLVVALYPAGSGENVAAVRMVKKTGIEANGEYNLTFNLENDFANTLFNGKTDGASCRMYAVANVGDIDGIDETATIAELKKIKASSSFDSEKVQDSFIMAGEGIVTFSKNDAGEKASGEGTLHRAAAKAVLSISLPASVEQDGRTWEPQTSGGAIRVLVNNGVKSSISVPGGEDNWTPEEEDYYRISNKDLGVVRTMTASNSTDFPYTLDVPFYTYPNYWEETPQEQRKTTMTLMVPWKVKGTDQYVTYYYEVPVTDGQSLSSNNAYLVNLKVNMLGSLTPSNPLELEGLTYKVVDWNEQSIDVNINDYRFLVVSPKEYVINNREEFTIPFYSSHDVIVKEITMEYDEFNYYSDGNGKIVTIKANKDVIDASDKGFVVYSTTKSTGVEYELKIKHPLEIWAAKYDKTTTSWWGQTTTTEEELSLTGNSTRNTDYEKIKKFEKKIIKEAYTPFRFTVKLCHKDDESFNETLTIVQYPAMYITALPFNGNGDNGQVFVNNSNDKSADFGGVFGLNGGNKNPNMYVISTSVLTDSKYHIGDPRNTAINNLNYISNTTDLTVSSTEIADWCASATNLYDNKNQELRYYMPTLEGNTKEDFIAPKIRVASSYGVTNPVSRSNARKRMASYQERDCAAGRWRLPTKAELEYIITLSSTGKIPVLFSVGSDYWTAQGLYTVNSDGSISLQSSDRNTTAYVRGVYDEWYWEKQSYNLTPGQSSYTFTWGDMPYQGINE